MRRAVMVLGMGLVGMSIGCGGNKSSSKNATTWV